MIKTVQLTALQDRLQEEMPGVYLGMDYQRYEVILGVRFQINTASHILPDDERLPQYLGALVEQLRLRGIRELGLRPKLDAYEREVWDYRQANRLLNEQLRKASEKIGQLQQELEELRPEEEGDD